MVRRADSGTLEIGRTLPGRGAWLCAGSTACIAQAARKGALHRALRAQITPAAVEALRVALEGCARITGRFEGAGGRPPQSSSESEGK